MVRKIWPTEIETLSESPESAFLDRETFDSNYFRLVSEASILLNQSRRRSSAASDDGSSSSRECRHDFVRLPKIDLPHFNGDYQHWLEFRDTYISLIHNNTTISEINKFHYLRAALKGTAALSIKSLEFSSNNYHLAWQLLTERYDNERLLVNHHIQALFNFENITRECSRLLRNMVDITNKNLRALALLGQPTDHWDTLIIYIMSKKLDPTTTRQWEEYRNNINGIPNLQQYIKFLNNRADLLEAVYDNNNSFNKQKSYHTSPDTHKYKLHTAPDNHTSNSSYKCPICSQAHFIFSCETFRKLDIESRIKRIKELNVCRNCLRPGHNHNQCRLTHCKYCNNKHNTLLHMSLESPKEFEEMTLALSTQLSVNQGNQPTALLSTALVRVADVHNKLHTARLLLDNGSTSNFVSKQFSERLGLVKRHVSSTVHGINCQSSLTSESCDIAILSLCGNYKQNITCYILPEITKYLPSTYIDIKTLHIPKGIHLADPNFNIPSEIDILVGAEVFWSILGTGIMDLVVPEVPIWNRYSSLTRLIRIVAYCRRFLDLKRPASERNRGEYLTASELAQALETCIKQCQVEHFQEELELIRKDGKFSKIKGHLKSLNPYVDEKGLLRIGGRLDNMPLSLNARHPILLPKKSTLTALVIADAHVKTLHGGIQLMLTYLGTKFFILGAKSIVKAFVRKCVTCIRYNATTSNQLMGQLPAVRVTPARPFKSSGVDYAGPINIRTTKGRGHHAYKGYICLFVCMVSKAVHIELVSDLTSQGFLTAFKRFVARRGPCTDLWRVNGTNFVGAARELKILLTSENSTLQEELSKALATNGTFWHFIPPHSPNFGGLWEAGIKSIKFHLKRVIGDATLTYEELSTVLTQIEACLNSRPLARLDTESDAIEALTPGHFLVGEPLVTAPDYNFEASNLSCLRRWQLTQIMMQNFWKRWSQEYLTKFLHRYKWAYQHREPGIGDILFRDHGH
ncbi:hypothetical protein K1T71_015239 [Dendrolimus kikuchii]|nr:hypothetical protein K1T71_015239 [Dendrolimus kikuchii]